MSAVTIANYVIGKAKVGVRAVGVLTPYTEIQTLEDTTIRINAGAEVFDPSVELEVGGPVQGFQYQPRPGGIEVEFSIAQLDATNLGILLPGSTSVAAATTVVGGGLSTTLAAAAAVGDTNIKVTAVTSAAVGDYVSIDTAGNIEYRQLTFVGTAGAGGTGLGFFMPLSIAHANAVAVVETVGDGRTTFSPALQGRIATASYQEFRVLWPRPDTSWGEIKIYRGLASLDNPYELTTGPRTMARVRTTVTGYRDPANVEASPFALIQ